MKTLFNVINIKCIEVTYSMTKRLELFCLKHRKGDVIRRGIKVLGITLVKPKIATENLYESVFPSEIIGWFDIKRSYNQCEVGNDGELYYKPHIKVEFIDDTKKVKYFECDKELMEFFKKEIKDKINNFISI